MLRFPRALLTAHLFFFFFPFLSVLFQSYVTGGSAISSSPRARKSKRNVHNMERESGSGR